MGLPQSALAQALGIAQRALSTFEAGTRRPSALVRERLAAFATSLYISWEWIEHGKRPVLGEAALVDPGVDAETPPEDLFAGTPDPRAVERVSQLRVRVTGATTLTEPLLLDLLELLTPDAMMGWFTTAGRLRPVPAILGRERFRQIYVSKFGQLTTFDPGLDARSRLAWLWRCLWRLSEHELPLLEPGKDLVGEEQALRARLFTFRGKLALLPFLGEVAVIGTGYAASTPLQRATADRAKLAAGERLTPQDHQFFSGESQAWDRSSLAWADHLLTFCAETRVSPRWLLTGEGPRSLWQWLAECDRDADPHLLFMNQLFQSVRRRAKRGAVPEARASAHTQKPVIDADTPLATLPVPSNQPAEEA